MSDSKRIFTKHVHVHNGAERISFRPGDEVPDWAEITNPKVFTDATPGGVQSADTPAASTPQTPPAAPADDLDTLDRDALQAIAGTLEISKRLGDDNLRAAIREKRAADAAAAEAAANAEPTGRAALEAALTAKGIEFTAENSDEELEAFLEGA